MSSVYKLHGYIVIVKRQCTCMLLVYFLYECPTPHAAPPLTVDNVLKVIKGVSWHSFGKHLCHYCNLDKIVESCVSDEARLEAVVKHYLESGVYEHSWRTVIWSLYKVNQIELADPRIRSYAEPLKGVLAYSHECMIRSSMVLLCL